MTKIEWCDETHNIVAGCTKVSPGCEHCYAERMAVRLAAMDRPGYADGVTYYPGCDCTATPCWSGKVVPIPGAVERLAAKCAFWRKPRRIFVQSMGDLFHEAVPFELVDRVAAIVANNPQHIFDFLTKRPGRMREWASRPGMPGRLQDAHLAAGGNLLWHEVDAPSWPLPNLFLGVTAENQEQADARIPVLLDTPAAVRYVSVEPILGPVDLAAWTTWPAREMANIGRAIDYALAMGGSEPDDECGPSLSPALSWVICGGETGPGAREMNPKWAQDLRDQCKVAGVPYFFKKLGTYREKHYSPELDTFHYGLDVREFPRAGR